ncbi:L,D-transpeptidase family protein [Arenicella xantha]|uniref:Murein L,D-transpeptidase YafK n=1 Tax=Arenicella xantha TaxID=644221 RepID=A0A395JP46_9GAMM|nr:L,D-transpeptidase family protein [Arenicella xantha]RBP53404.1 murein L,D-transpeptidase YafK [Arenicella xantha]
MIGSVAKRSMWCLLVAGLLAMSVQAIAATEVIPDKLASLHALQASAEYEPSVLAIVEAIRNRDLDLALSRADKHLKDFPKSRVGYLLRAEVLAALAGDEASLGKTSELPSETSQGLLHQLRNRWQHGHVVNAEEHTKWPANLLMMGQHQHALVADLAKGRLYVYQNIDGQPKLVRDYYLTMGSQGFGKEVEGDNKTPVGLYQVIRHIEGKALPDLYGKGAFPVDYPNKYDRFLGRTGYGIWLHGTPSDTYARSPWSSEGCFVLSNDDLLDVAQFISVEQRTPVLLSDQVEWLTAEQLANRQAAMLAVLAKWEADWESLDTDAFLSHYAEKDFNFGRGNFSQWAARKRQVNKAKTYVKLSLEVTGLFAYPGVKDMFVVNFIQGYDSSNFSNSSNKQQFWQRQADGQWRIVYEGKQ